MNGALGADAAIQGIPGVLKLVDDILIYAPNLSVLQTELYRCWRDVSNMASPYPEGSYRSARK